MKKAQVTTENDFINELVEIKNSMVVSIIMSYYQIGLKIISFYKKRYG